PTLPRRAGRSQKSVTPVRRKASGPRIERRARLGLRIAGNHWRCDRRLLVALTRRAVIGERVAEEVALALERLTGTAWVLHHADFLRQQPCHVEGMRLPAPAVADVQGVVAIDINRGAFRERLLSVRTEMIQATGNAGLTQAHALNHRVRGEPSHAGPSLAALRGRNRPHPVDSGRRTSRRRGIGGPLASPLASPLAFGTLLPDEAGPAEGP